ncbi:unnamed protein product [Parnassius mnemosyne]
MEAANVAIKTEKKEEEEQNEGTNLENMITSVWIKIEKDDEEEYMPLDEEQSGTEREEQQGLQLNKCEDKPKKKKRQGETIFCELCDYSTCHKNCLKIHMLSHNTTKPFACEFCDYATKYPLALNRHKSSKHQAENEDPNGSKKEIPFYKCDQCDYVSRFKSNLKSHKRKHKTEKQFKCSECSYETAYRHNFMKHCRQHSKITFNCDKCDFVTQYEGHIYRHLSNVHNDVMDYGYTCNFCDFSTAVRWRLNIHQQRSKQEGLLKCANCDFETMYKCEMKRHNKEHFGGTNGRKVHMKFNSESFSCPPSVLDAPLNEPEYSQEPKDVNYENDHQKFNHYTLDPNCLEWSNIPVKESDDIDRPYQCQMCSYTSKFKAAVQRHFQRHHTDKQNRPFKCCNCNFSTKTKDQITLHNKRSQSNKPLYCSECRFTTLFKCQFVMHQKSHYQYKCNICNYAYKNKYYLQKHSSVHQLGKTMKCQYCDYKTARADSLASHEATHTGDKPIKCQYCDYRTIRNCFLIKHISRYHIQGKTDKDADENEDQLE